MKKALSLLLTLILTAGCAMSAFAADETLYVYSSYKIPYGTMRMTAHRGYSAVAPENTLPAFELAGEYGFWGAECDTSVTSDGVWVIMHDDTVDRMTDGEGRIAELTFEEVRKLTVDAGSNVESYPDLRVPTLTEYLDVCKKHSMHPVIEIKDGAAPDDMDSLAELLLARGERDMFVIITFSAPLAARIKSLMPDTPVYLLIGDAPVDEFYQAIGFCVENGLDGIDLNRVWRDAQISAAKDAGLDIMVWTVDDTYTAEIYYKLGVRDVTTNTLTPGRPDGSVFDKVIWALRDLFFSIKEFFDGLFARASAIFVK